MREILVRQIKIASHLKMRLTLEHPPVSRPLQRAPPGPGDQSLEQSADGVEGASASQGVALQGHKLVPVPRGAAFAGAVLGLP